MYIFLTFKYSLIISRKSYRLFTQYLCTFLTLLVLYSSRNHVIQIIQSRTNSKTMWKKKNLCETDTKCRRGEQLGSVISSRGMALCLARLEAYMKSWAVMHDGEIEQLDLEIKGLPLSLVCCLLSFGGLTNC